MKNILDLAQDIVLGDRSDDYGPISISFGRIAELWSVVLGIDISMQQVALCMIQLKIAREMNKHKDDNLVDIAGYALLLSHLEEGL